MASSSAAAAGARACSVSALHGTAGAADGLYGMLGSPGTPGGNERRRRSSGARSSPAMADGGFGCSWGGGYRAHSKGERGRGGVGAHNGAVEEVSELGEVLAALNRPEASSGAGGGRRRWWRRCRGSRGALLGEEEEGVEEDLLGTSGERGRPGGRGEQRRWRRLRSAREGERNRGGGELGRE